MLCKCISKRYHDNMAIKLWKGKKLWSEGWILVPLLLNLLSSDFILLWLVALSEHSFASKQDTESDLGFFIKLVTSEFQFTPIKMVRIYLHKAESQTTFSSRCLLMMLSSTLWFSETFQFHRRKLGQLRSERQFLLFYPSFPDYILMFIVPCLCYRKYWK